MKQNRRFPNILISGTPGTGKTTLCEHILESIALSKKNKTEVTHSNDKNLPIKFEHVKVGELIKEHRLFTEWDDSLDVPIFDDEMVLNHLETTMTDSEGGKVVDFHSGECFPASWFDLIIVLRANTDVIFDRLKDRGYADAKIRENVESEIFQVVLDAVTEKFDDLVEIWSVENNNLDDLQQLLDRLQLTLQAQCT